MDCTALLAGAVGGAAFVAAAHALPRRTRGILVAGLFVAALFYVYFAATARASPGWLAVELAGVAVYGGMALGGRRGSLWWIAAGWALHPLWDVTLHYVGPGRVFAPAWYTTLCLTWDLVVAAYVAGCILLQTRTRLAAADPGAPTARGA
jgi:hypothetical protein